MRRQPLSLTILIALVASLTGCPNEGLVEFGVVMGTVQDSYGTGLGEVVVSLGDRTTTSNSQGYFLIDELDELERAVVSFRKGGYVMTSEATRVRIGESSYLEAVMMPFGTQQNVPGTTGGTVTSPNGGSVSLPPNFAVGPNGQPWTAEVAVAVTLFDPSTDAGLAAFPGEFLGTDLNGDEALLISFSFMDVTLSDPATGGPA
jgi:hypothetical protein